MYKGTQRHKDTKTQRKAAISNFVLAAFLCAFVSLCSSPTVERRFMHRTLLIVIAIVLLASVAVAGQKPQIWTPSKTAWGDPDLQGTWTSDDSIQVPLQRPVNIGDRLTATEDEI